MSWNNNRAERDISVEQKGNKTISCLKVQNKESKGLVQKRRAKKKKKKKEQIWRDMRKL